MKVFHFLKTKFFKWFLDCFLLSEIIGYRLLSLFKTNKKKAGVLKSRKPYVGLQRVLKWTKTLLNLIMLVLDYFYSK
jgi:hypothetical protein